MDCPRCGDFNSMTAEACCKCGEPLQQSASRPASGTAAPAAEPASDDDAEAIAARMVAAGRSDDEILVELKRVRVGKRKREAAIGRARAADRIARHRDKALAFFVVGVIITFVSLSSTPGGYVVLAWGPILWGFVEWIRAGRLAREIAVLPDNAFRPKRPPAPPVAQAAAAFPPALGDLESAPVELTRGRTIVGEAPLLAADGQSDKEMTLAIVPLGSCARWLRRLGMGSFRTGDASFDELFRVTANDDERARLWLGHDHLRAALIRTPQASFRVAFGFVRARFPGHAATPERLSDFKRAISLLCNAPALVLHRWSQLAHRLGGELSLCGAGTHPAIVLQKDGLAVTVETANTPRENIRQPAPLFVRIRVSASRSSGRSRFAVLPAQDGESITRHLSFRGKTRDFHPGFVVRAERLEEVVPMLRERVLPALPAAALSAIAGGPEGIDVYLKASTLDAPEIETAMGLACALARDSATWA